jgi:predicted secreted protein
MAADILAALDSPAAAALDPWRVVSACAPYLRIAHQIAGRVRLKLDAAALDDAALRRAGADRLHQAIDSIRGVRHIQLNLLARSCVVEYDNGTIPDAAWPDLLAGRHTAAAATLVGILQEKYEEIRNGQL